MLTFLDILVISENNLRVFLRAVISNMTQLSTLYGTLKWVSAFSLSNNKWRWWTRFHSCLQAGQWLKSVRFVQRSAAVWRCAAFIAWTGWTLATTQSHDVSTINIVLILLLSSLL